MRGRPFKEYTARPFPKVCGESPSRIGAIFTCRARSNTLVGVRGDICKPNILVKMLAEKFVGTQGGREGDLGRNRRTGETFSDSSNGCKFALKVKKRA